jgi:hypothetical protein
VLRTKIAGLLERTREKPGQAGDGSAPAPVDLAEQLLEEFEQLLIRGNTRALDYLPRLEGAWKGNPPPQWQTLVKQVKHYEFRQAMESLTRLRQGGS